MEELSEVQHDEDKSFSDKVKRKLKTPAQLQGLEEFYKEHKYPTDSLKAEIAENLGLTYKQVSGWFCHRRLKDKRLSIKNDGVTPGKQDLSSGVVQDRGSGLKQDSCSSTKQGDYKIADPREVESGKLSRDKLHEVELNYEQRRVYGATEMDDTSSESDSGLQERFHPNPLSVKTSEYQPANGFIPKRRGPSGYLKIKGQMENSAITAVKRQLGRHYREDGPPLGIEFDPLPPGAFESSSKNFINDGYSVPDSRDISGIPSGIPIRPGHGNTRKQEMYEAAEHRSFHKADEEDGFSYRKPKQRPSVPIKNHKSSFGLDTYSSRETSDYDVGSRNLSAIQRRHGSEEPWSSRYNSSNPNVVRRKEQSDFRALVRHKGPVNTEEKPPSARIVEDKELCMERRPMAMSELHDSLQLNSRPSNELRGGKREREELLEGDYALRTPTQERTQWSRPVKGSTMEMPSSFSEDETAETSTSEDD